MAQDRKTALVTGASAGIGKAFALELARRDFDLVLTSRRRDRLEEVAAEIARERSVRIEIVPEDLSDPGASERLLAAVRERGLFVDLLVNNAGYGISVRFSETSWKEQADFLQVMVTAVAELTHRCLPSMLERGYGRIVNVASLAGLLHGAPGATLYAAAKSFLIKMSESLALELQGTGVSVTAVCPGFTFSEFHDRNHTRERVKKLPSAMWMDAESVARQGVDAALAGEIVMVNGVVNRAIATAMKHLPDAMARQIMLRQAKNFRRLD